MKKLILTIFLLVITCFNTVLAENFYIENYDVDIKVGKDKVLSVVENIDANFTNSSHGIIRKIPYKLNDYIDNINVSEQKSISQDSQNYNIKIGNPNKLIYGNHHYTISYKHHLKDNSNEFYYNIIGQQWNTNINNFKFNIEMPKIYNFQNFGLSVGEYGTVGQTNRVQYTLNGTNISGYSLRGLQPYEGVTVRISLPNNYFNIKTDSKKFIVFCLISLLTIIGFLMWFFIGKDKHVTPIINFYSPNGYNSAEAELIYKGCISTKGLVSLIIYLANKGHLKIKDKSNGFVLYRGENHSSIVSPMERKLLEILFETTSRVDEYYLKNSRTFYLRWSELLAEANENRTKIFEKNSISFMNKAIMFIIMTGVIYLTIYTISGFNSIFVLNNLPILICPIIGTFIIVTISEEQQSFPLFIFAFIWFVIPILIFFNPSSLTSNLYLLDYCIFCIIVNAICIYHMPKRNDFGNMQLGQILGFKRFLETVELSRVESLVKKNPNYCYDVLPYLYVFDLSDKWIKQFENLFVSQPDWYEGRHLNAKSFDNLTKSISEVTVPSQMNGGISSSSSGGGGGFSGGGCGGGGGCSW